MFSIFNRFNLILIAVILLLSTTLIGIFNLYQIEKEDSRRYYNNMKVAFDSRSRQQDLTIRELKELYPKYDSLANELNIKTKYITNIINTKYNFRDTTITKSVVNWDTLHEKGYFNLTEKNYKLNGYIERDSVTFTNKEFHDNITTFLYKDWEKKYLWGLIKLRPYYRAKVFSEFMNDTIKVQDNIKIVK